LLQRGLTRNPEPPHRLGKRRRGDRAHRHSEGAKRIQVRPAFQWDVAEQETKLLLGFRFRDEFVDRGAANDSAAAEKGGLGSGETVNPATATILQVRSF